ncbi:MAG: sigma-54 dependent transcriptional regulator [Phycisphaerae bacterium]|nr:sigma-54 dependent transcriptional regulator [Phycisphaerae bacterium]
MNNSDLQQNSYPAQQNSKASLLIAENDSAAVRTILKASAMKGLLATVATDVAEALRLSEYGRFDLVFIGEGFCSGNLRLLEKIKIANPEMPVILLADCKNDNLNETIQNIVELIQAGITNVILKPVENTAIIKLFETLVPNRPVTNIAGCPDSENNIYSIIGSSSELLKAVELARKTAASSVPVLLAGESGTGKELFARLIHRFSNRTTRPYVTVNCAALNDAPLESELFGHEKGAFTGAFTQRKGRFEMANGGTILLDEISETPLSFQAKLLRVLEQQDFQRVGGNENIKVNVRLICTTNRDLLALVRERKFRLDLYYRICGVKLVLPPLKERKDDMHDLVWHFVNLYSHQTNRRISRLDPAMLEDFCRFNWPGNIRQLRNVVRMLLVLGQGQTLSIVNIPWLLEEPSVDDDTSNPGSQITGLGKMPLEHIEQCAILETLRQNDNNQTQAARVLGISDRTLREKVKKYKTHEILQNA